jgi:hypothetical protein
MRGLEMNKITSVDCYEQIDLLTTSYREIRKENFELRRQLDGCTKSRDYWYDVSNGHVDKDE